MDKRNTQIPLLIVLAAGLAACNPSAQANPTAGEGPALSAGAGTPARTVSPSPSGTFTPTATTPPLPCNLTTVAKHITIPDGTIMAPGTPFTKTWQLKNIGSCKWSADYQLVFDHGDRMNESDSWAFPPVSVASGSYASVSVDLVAPAAEGTYQAFFKIRAADGTTFGMGPKADTAFWVKIVVRNPSTPLPSRTLTPTMDESAPCVSIKYIEDVTIPDGWEVGPNTVFTKTWRLQNTGGCRLWSTATLVFDYGDRMGAPGKESLMQGDEFTDYGGIFDASVELISPATPGTYQGNFKIFVPHGPGERNGSYAALTLSVKIRIISPTATPAGTSAVQVVSNQKSVAPARTVSVAAYCPPGTVVTGGGYSSYNPPKDDPFGSDYYMILHVYSLRMEANGWMVQAVNDSPESYVLSVYAICLKHPAAVITQVESTIPVQAGSNGVATAPCPAGSVVTGGGFTVNNIGIMRSTKQENGWRIIAVNGGNVSSEITAYAICLSGAPASAALVSGSGNAAEHSHGFATSECPGGSVLTGGGFINGGSMLFDEISIHGRMWVVHGLNDSVPNAKFESHAICLTFE
jgi:hypothetical protein